MTSLFSKLGIKTVLTVSTLGLVPTAAFAGHHDGIRVDLHLGVPPVIVTAPAPGQRVWVPDQFEFRDVVHHEYHRRWIERRRVLVTPAHFEDVTHQELITPGHWESHLEQVRVG